MANGTPMMRPKPSNAVGGSAYGQLGKEPPTSGTSMLDRSLMGPTVVQMAPVGIPVGARPQPRRQG